MQPMPDIAALLKIAQSPAGQKLLAILQSRNPAGLDQIAATAATGNLEEAKQRLSSMLSDPETKEIRDTVASVRLDSIISSGFRIGRSAAAQYVNAGKVAIDGLPCEKPDKVVEEGAKISVRGLGKIKLRSINGQTKKGRISVVIDRYI